MICGVRQITRFTMKGFHGSRRLLQLPMSFSNQSAMHSKFNLAPGAIFRSFFTSTISVSSILGRRSELLTTHFQPILQTRSITNKLRKRWKIRKYHFKLRLKRTMRKMRVPYVSSKSRGQVKKKPILHDFRPHLRSKLQRAER